MPKILSPMFATLMLAGFLAGCQNAQWNPSDAEMCKDYHGLTPGTWEYNYCVDNMGEPFKRTEVID